MGRVMAIAMKDSKRGIAAESADEISDVLLRKVGDIVATRTQNLSKFPAILIEKWLVEMGFPSSGEADATFGVASENNEIATDAPQIMSFRQGRIRKSRDSNRRTKTSNVRTCFSTVRQRLKKKLPFLCSKYSR